jgi:hypothetical protein
MELTLRFYGVVMKLLWIILTPFLYLIFDIFGKRGKVPPLKSPLLEICAVDLAEKIRKREVGK